MNYKRIILMVGLILLWTAVVPAADGQWLHVRVQDSSEAKESVKINVPLALIETVLPLIEVDELKQGSVKVDSTEITVAEMRQIWDVVKQQGDYELATVESQESRVRISLEGNHLYVRSSDDSESEVLVSVPTSVVDALLSGDKDELNVKAAVQALATSGPGDLVTVQDGEKMVRIWIDASNTAE